MSEVERAHAGARGTLFATAFAQSRNPLALLDARRRHVDVNDAYLALLHYSREQLLGRPVYELVLASPTATSEQWRAALESGRFTGQGSGVTFRGVVYYQTASERLSRLNGLAGIYEYETDAAGDVTLKVWEWK